MRRRSLLAGMAASLSAQAAWAADARTDDLDQILAKAFAGKAAPGAGVLVIRDGQVAGKAVRGVRRLGETAPIGPDDVWNIGSDGKTMTVAMIARLVERGALAWDAPLQATLPDLAAGMRPEYRPVTLKQLHSHRSGLPHDLRDVKAADALFYEPSSASTADRRLGYIARTLQDAPAGSAGRFSYSNTGYLIAAAAAERAAGATCEALMRKEVFEPLAMRSANFGLPPAGQPGGHNHGRLAVPRDENPDFFAPAGNIYLSLDDWARFCIDQLKGAKGQGQLLKPESYALMQTAQPGAPVSMGWFLESKFGDVPGPILHHEGSDGAWYAVAALFPTTGAGVLTVANAGKDMDGMALTMALATAAARLVAR